MENPETKPPKTEPEEPAKDAPAQGALSQSSPWLLTEAGMTYVLAFLGGGLLIAGSFLPWLDFGVVNIFFDASASQTTAIGGWGLGFGVVTFIIGLLIIGGLVKKPFGIPQRLYMGTLGLSALLVAVVFLIDFVDGDARIGFWLTLAGGGVLTLQFLWNTLLKKGETLPREKNYEKSFSTTDQTNLISDCNTWNIGGLLIPGLIAAFILPFVSELTLYNLNILGIGSSAESTSSLVFEGGSAPTLLHPELRGIGSILIALLFAQLALCLLSKTKYRPDAGVFLLLSFPAFAICGVSFMMTLTTSSGLTSIGVGAAAWAIFIVSIFTTAIAYRSVSSKIVCEV